MLSEKDNALKEVNSRLEKEKFIPGNIRDDTIMKALTSFTIKEFFCIYRFLQIEDDLSVDNKRRSIDRYFMFLVKLRTGISNEFLSVSFGISDSTVSRDFNLVTDVLHDKLKLQGMSSQPKMR
ncbi:HTH_Tnp_4 domain-containing protein [Trichonephila clavata]|uniref:HTH_Tnp_4 domain-containing protein n=1 Tax=Trichonephila clavata TaxID=2740835 RepID=A0A8X6F753_TRICU|nr:HTH_Tnp_4 domain-containing protein [Trichonephila clavata]